MFLYFFIKYKKNNYEGRSVSKLQNNIFHVSFPNRKNVKYSFIGNFILNTCKKIFWWWRHYCDVICSQNSVYIHVYYFPHQ